MEEHWRPEFEQALGETFGPYVSPPVPFGDASAHECCEAIWSVLGRDVTPTKLASLTHSQIAQLASAFGTYFETDAPSEAQIGEAIADTLAYWPVGSLGEGA